MGFQLKKLTEKSSMQMSEKFHKNLHHKKKILFASEKKLSTMARKLREK